MRVRNRQGPEREKTAEDWRMMHDLMLLQQQVVLFGAAYVRERLREAQQENVRPTDRSGP